MNDAIAKLHRIKEYIESEETQSAADFFNDGEIEEIYTVLHEVEHVLQAIEETNII